MAVTGKGKQIAGKSVASSSSGKRKRVVSAAEVRGGGGSSRRKRRPGVLQFFDDAAVDTDSESEDEDGEMEDQNDDGDHTNQAKVEMKDTKGSGGPYALPFFLKEEDLSGDELEELINERYGRNSEYVVYGEESKEYDEDSKIDGTIWRVKCMVGRERHIVFCLMQKFADLHNFGNRLHIISAFCLEHVKGYIYVEADKESDVIESCKGFCNVYLNRVGLVPKHEIPHLFSVQSKACEVSRGTWVRMKSGNYKGDIAKVVAVDEERKKATIKLVPRIDLQAIAQKMGGGISMKHAAVPPPRFLSSRELEGFRSLIETRRDRQTGELFEIIDGLMLKDGYLYKKVSIASLVSWGVEPSKTELQKFTEPNRDGPEDLEWVSSIYGSSKKMRSVEASEFKMTVKQGNAFGLHDLVFFGSKSFGVIVAMEKDSFQILKGDMEEPIAVTVKAQEIKNICADKLFTAPDFKVKSISINDIVKVIEGPYQGRQGTVRHMYKGRLFIYDENQLENGGFFCVKSNLCENTKESHEDVKSRPTFTETSMSSSVQRDTSHSFNRGCQRDRDHSFSIGQTLRIRKGPLKGYLCRVVGIYRSDITVKLDSLVKVITVQDNVLSEPNFRRDVSAALPSDLFGTHEWKPSGLAEDGKETSVAKISWDAGMTSSGRDSWQGFSSNIISSGDGHKTDQEHVPDPWGKRVASGQDQEHIAVPWGSKAASEHDQERGGDPWGSKVAAVEDNGNGTDAWGSKAAFGKDQENRADAWGSKTAPRKDQERGDDPWGSKATIGRDKESGAEPWESKMVPGKDKESRAEPWGSKTSPGKDKENGPEPWGSKTLPGKGPWGNKATSGRDLKQAELWGSKTASGKVIDSGFDPWGSKVTSSKDQKQDVNMWGDKDSSNVVQRSAWDRETVTGKDKEDALDIKGKNIINEVDTWSKLTGSQENNNPEKRDWVKSCDQTTSSCGAQASGWGSAAVRLSQSAAENVGQSSTWDKVKVTSVETDSWAGTKISTDAGTGNWNKAGSSNPKEIGGWNKQKTSGGDPVPSWNNRNNYNTGVNYQRDSWEKPSNFEDGRGLARGGGRGHGWQRGGNDNYGAGGARDQENSPNQETEFDGSQQSSWGVGRGRGSGRFGARGRGRNGGSRGSGFGGSGGSWGSGRGRAEGRNGDDDSADARLFGRGRGRGCGRLESSDWKNSTDAYGDGCFSRNTMSAWGNDQGGGWEKSQGFGKNDVSAGNGEQQGDWSKPKSFGGEQSANRNTNDENNGWNTPKPFGSNQPSTWDDKGYGTGKTASWSKNEGSSWSTPKASVPCGGNREARIENAGSKAGDGSGLDIANSCERKQPSGCNTNVLSGEEQHKSSNVNMSFDWNSNGNGNLKNANTLGHDSSGWNKNSGRNESGNLAADSDTWGGAKSGSDIQTNETNNWNISKAPNETPPSKWNQNTAGWDADKGEGGSGNWGGKRTYTCGSQPSGWNDGDGTSWNKRKSFASDQPTAWNDKSAGYESRCTDQSEGWHCGKNSSSDQQSDCGRSSFNRGRGRGRNFTSGHTSSWNGADMDGGWEQSETSRGQKTFGKGQSSGWSQGESTGRGGGGPQGNRNGSRGGRGGRWGEGGPEGSGGRWGEGSRGGHRGRWNGGGRDGSRGRWNDRGRGGSGGRWNQGKEPCENGPSDKGSWGAGNDDKGSWGGWKSNTGISAIGRTGQNSDWNKGPSDGEGISSAGDWNRPNESKTVDGWSQKNITGRSDGSGGWKASGAPAKETGGDGQQEDCCSRWPSHKGEQASSWNQKGANASGWTEQSSDWSKSPMDGASDNKADDWNRPNELIKADDWSQKNISGCDDGSDGWKVTGAPAKETEGARQQEDAWGRGPHKEQVSSQNQKASGRNAGSSSNDGETSSGWQSGSVLAKELKDSSPQKEEAWGQGASPEGKNSSGWDSRSELTKEINDGSTQKEESQGQEASALTWGQGASTKEASTSDWGSKVSAEAFGKEASALTLGLGASTVEASTSDWGQNVSAEKASASAWDQRGATKEASASDWGQRGSTKEASLSDWVQVSSIQEAPASDCGQGQPGESSLSDWVGGTATKESGSGVGETGSKKSADLWGKANEGGKDGW